MLNTKRSKAGAFSPPRLFMYFGVILIPAIDVLKADDPWF